MSYLNGLLLIDKPMGCTSHDIVDRVRRILRTRTVGHAGTLDPMATGLLVLLVGDATKISDYVLNENKSYELVVRLGVVSDTLDRTGQLLKESPVDVDPQRIAEEVDHLQGPLNLPVPRFSAVKRGGRKLYEYAREQVEVERPLRVMTFAPPQLISIEGPRNELVRVRLNCSKGSYVRSWAEALGERLGCGAWVEELRRLSSEPYSVEQAVTLPKLQELWSDGGGKESITEILGSSWIPLAQSLPSFQTVKIDAFEERLMRNGQISKGLEIKLIRFFQEGRPAPGVKVISQEREALISLLQAEEGQFYRIRRVFPFST